MRRWTLPGSSPAGASGQVAGRPAAGSAGTWSGTPAVPPWSDLQLCSTAPSSTGSPGPVRTRDLAPSSAARLSGYRRQSVHRASLARRYIPARRWLARFSWPSSALSGPSVAAASKLVTLEAPSRHVDPASAAFGGEGPHELKVNVLLPDGYRPSRAYPLLYLMHGAGESHRSWADPEKGDVANTLAGLNAIIAMPEGGLGYYTNWWNGGKRADPGWERYHLDEVIPLLERRFKIRKRAALARDRGFSMARLRLELPRNPAPGLLRHARADVGPGLDPAARGGAGALGDQRRAVSGGLGPVGRVLRRGPRPADARAQPEAHEGDPAHRQRRAAPGRRPPTSATWRAARSRHTC